MTAQVVPQRAARMPAPPGRRWLAPCLLCGLLVSGAAAPRAFAASTLGTAQPGAFRQTDLDAGGWLTGFASHPAGRLYARTDVGGVYRSDDHGATWR